MEKYINNKELISQSPLFHLGNVLSKKRVKNLISETLAEVMLPYMVSNAFKEDLDGGIRVRHSLFPSFYGWNNPHPFLK